MVVGPRTETGGSPTVRLVLTVTLTVLMVITITFNALAGVGKSPFSNPTGNVSDTYNTCFTPAGFTFAIWSIIYICLVIIIIYSISVLIRRNGGEPVWKLGGALPASFLLMFCLSCILNVAWLFVWDRMLITAAAIGLLLIGLTNDIALVFSAYWFSKASATLLQRSKVDFWFGAFVVNGYATYAAWTFLASLLNLAIFLIHQVELEATKVCIAMLSIIPIVLVTFAILEAFVFVKVFNVLFTPYFVYLWASYGIYSKNKDSSSDAVYALMWTNIAVAATLCVARLVTIAVRNCRGGVYTNSSVQDISDPSLQDDKRY